LGRTHVEELNEIRKYADDSTFDQCVEQTIAGELTRDELRELKHELNSSDNEPPKVQPPEIENEPEEGLNLSEDQKEQVAFIVENRSLSREEYLKSLSETDDVEKRLNQNEAQLRELIEENSRKNVEVRMQERQKMLNNFDFDSESKFATGNANHLAPPVETDNLGVFFHDCQQMGDELDDDSVNLVFTSPPYFTQRERIVDEWCPENAKSTQDSVDTAYENYLDVMMSVIQKCHEKLADGGHLIINLSDYQVKNLQKVYDIPSDFSHRIRHAEGLNFEYISTITWDKDSKTSSRLANFRQSNNVVDFRPAWQTERILVFRKGGKRKKQEYTIDRSEIKNDCNGFDPMADLWMAAPTTTRDADHESGFPKRLPYLAVKLFTYPGDTVIDPFGGFATTLRAVKSVNQEEPDAPSRTGFAWENFASESNDQQDYRKRIDDLLTGSLTQFRDDHQIVN
jgi:DNA modification methylase